MQPLLCFRFVLRCGGRVAVEQDSRFGRIRRDDIRNFAQLAHTRAHFGCIGGVDLTVVAHHPVDERRTVFGFQPQYGIPHAVYLICRAEKARVHRLKP